MTGAGLHLDTADLHAQGGALTGLADALGGVQGTADDIRSAFGHDDVAHEVVVLSSQWDDKRRGMVEVLRSLSGMFPQVAEEFFKKRDAPPVPPDDDTERKVSYTVGCSKSSLVHSEDFSDRELSDPFASGGPDIKRDTGTLSGSMTVKGVTDDAVLALIMAAVGEYLGKPVTDLKFNYIKKVI